MEVDDPVVTLNRSDQQKRRHANLLFRANY